MELSAATTVVPARDDLFTTDEQVALEEEGLITNSPAVHVRRPRLDYESHVTGLDRNEVGSLLVTAGDCCTIRWRRCRLPARWDRPVARSMGPRRVHVDRRV